VTHVTEDVGKDVFASRAADTHATRGHARERVAHRTDAASLNLATFSH